MRLSSALPSVADPALQTWKVLLEQDPSIRTITASTTALATDDMLLVDATAGAVVVTLPKAADNKGKMLTAKKIDASANAVTLDGNGAETIDGAATLATTTQWATLSVRSNGTAWFVV